MNRLEPATHPAFGLIAWLEATKITLPLKGVECHFEVTAGVASVEIDQIYHQSHAEPLDCTYSFPLPAGAAVYRCEMQVNGRVVRAKVEDREKAQTIFIEQKATGRRAALVEMERENLFTLSLGNLQPEDVIVLRLAYFQTIERAGTGQRLRIPVCPGVRYIPGRPLLRALRGRGTADDTDQVPDASRITPPRIDALHPDAAYFAAEGSIVRSEVAPDSLSSPTHRLLVREAELRFDLALGTTGAIPDRDLVVSWEEPDELSLVPRAWTCAQDGATYALVQLRAPVTAAVADDFEQDVYFLVDRSGSMAGAKWTKTCEALTAFVQILGPRDRVWITLFESAFLDFAEAPVAAPQVSKDVGFQTLVERGVGGGTEVLPAAEHVLAQIEKHSRGRNATVVLITDGQVGNEDEVLACFHAAPGVAVHAFGIDTAVNDAFLEQLARQQGGGCWLQTPHDDIARTISGLADRLRRPVLTALRLGKGWEAATAHLPNVHAGQVIELALRATHEAPLEISGDLGGGERHVFALAPTGTNNPALPLLWVRERIGSLLAAGQAAAAIDLAKEHNILCEGAAFIAWDEAEQVMIAKREIYQPSLCDLDTYLMDASPDICLMNVREPDKSPVFADPRMTEVARDRFLTAPTVEDDLIAAGVPREVAKELRLWAEANWLKRIARSRALRMLVEELEAVPRQFSRWLLCLKFIKHQLADEPVLRGRLCAMLGITGTFVTEP